jgi:hypothetical protein
MGVWLVSTKKKDAVYEVLEYNKVSKVAKLKGKYATIELVHYSRAAHFTNQQRVARDNEKFKLVEVKVCKMHTAKTVRR